MTFAKLRKSIVWGSWYKVGSVCALGKAVRIVGAHLSVLGGGPLGSKEGLGLCSSRLGETRGRGPSDYGNAGGT